MSAPDHKQIVIGSVVGGVINTVINGVINYFIVRGKEIHAVTSDSITAGSDTVLGHGVGTAALLAVIFTLIGFNSQKKNLPGVTWAQVGWLAVKNAIYAFGLMVIFGVLWQRVFPNMTVGVYGAAAIAGLIAGVVSGIVNYSTLTTLFDRIKR